MLRTLSSGAIACAAAVGNRSISVASVMPRSYCRHHPRKAGDPVFQRRLRSIEKPRRTGSPLEPVTGLARRRDPVTGMTAECLVAPGATFRLPPKPFRLARQLDGLDLLKLDGALGHEIVEVAIGWTCDFRTIEIDLERAAMILVGPGRGIADAFHAGRHPILLLVKTLGDVLAGRAAVLGGPVEGFLHVHRAAAACDVMHGAINLAGRVRHLGNFHPGLH